MSGQAIIDGLEEAAHLTELAHRLSKNDRKTLRRCQRGQSMIKTSQAWLQSMGLIGADDQVTDPGRAVLQILQAMGED